MTRRTAAVALVVATVAAVATYALLIATFGDAPVDLPGKVDDAAWDDTRANAARMAAAVAFTVSLMLTAARTGWKGDDR